MTWQAFLAFAAAVLGFFACVRLLVFRRLLAAVAALLAGLAAAYAANAFLLLADPYRALVALVIANGVLVGALWRAARPGPVGEYGTGRRTYDSQE